MEWSFVKLGDVCKIEKEQFREGELPYVGLEDIEGFTGCFLGDLNPRVVASSTFRFTSQHVLYGRLRPYLNKVLVPDFGGHCSSEIFPLKPTSQLDRKYLYYWLSSDSIVSAINATCTGARMPRANVNTVLTFEIPLPTISEQKRLVAILDEVFADIEQVRAKTEQNLKNARELFESYLQQVFSQRDEGWEVKPLESFSSIVNGYAFKSGDYSTESGAKSIKITNVGVYEFVEDDTSYLPHSYLKEFERYRAYEGDVVIALTRTIISTGLKVAVVPPSYNGALINQRVAAIQVDEQIMPKEALHAYLSSSMAVSYVKKNVSELLQPNLSIRDLRAFPVPIPPHNEREVFSEKIQSVRTQVEQLVSVYNSKLQALDELKKSILQKAFSGELTKTSDNKTKQGALA